MLEVGVIRTLLYHIKSGNQKSSNEIMDIINDLTLQRFRVPGAHTGFLPFSVAEESKQYVEEKLPIIESWFIQ